MMRFIIKWLLAIAIIFLLVALALFMGGCTVTNVSANTWQLKRTSFLQQVAMPELTVTTNGAVTLKGYSNDGGADLAADIVARIIKAAAK